MKHISTIVNTILAALLVLLLFTTGLPNSHARAATPESPSTQTETTCDSNRTVQVSGTAVINLAPDRALVELGVQSNGKTPREVQRTNAATIQRVIKSLKALGIEARDISTDHYMIEPLYIDYDSLQIKGYRIYNIVAVTVRDVTKTSEVLTEAFEAGANQVVNVEFYTSELRKYRDQAREMAMTAASEKAAALVQSAGAETTCVLTISENSWSYYHGGYWWYGRNNANLWTQNAVQNVPPASEPSSTESTDSPVSPGHISVQAQVSVTYGLK